MGELTKLAKLKELVENEYSGGVIHSLSAHSSFLNIFGIHWRYFTLMLQMSPQPFSEVESRPKYAQNSVGTKGHVPI